MVALWWPVLNAAPNNPASAGAFRQHLVSAQFRQLGDVGAMHLEKRNADGRWILPVPGTFVIDRAGNVAYAHVDPDYRNRPEPQEIVATCRSLRS